MYAWRHKRQCVSLLIQVYVKKVQSNKVGLIEAFADKDTKGYNWNNMMLQRWVDHNGDEHRVLDDYNRNVTLCDLSAQPPEIREIINNTIEEHMNRKKYKSSWNATYEILCKMGYATCMQTMRHIMQNHYKRGILHECTVKK